MIFFMKILNYIVLLLCLNLQAQVSELNCVCGNGIQEILPQSVGTCPYKLYGVSHLGPEDPSTLMYFNTYDGTSHDVGEVVGGGITEITAMDFSPDGVLYAVGRVNGEFSLATIDCQTAEASIIGSVNIEEGAEITAINFDSQGKLYAHKTAHDEAHREDGKLGMIHVATGDFVDIGHTESGQIGNGIAFAPFPLGNLYHAGTSIPASDPPENWRSLCILDTETGLQTLVATLFFDHPSNNNPRINDMDFDPVTNTMYVIFDDTAPGESAVHSNYLGVVNLVSGEVSYIKMPGEEAPDGLAAIAVNRPYETCDQGMEPPEGELPLPEGTSCSLVCAIVESACGDGEDNDFDGFIDCLDPDCDNQSCGDDLCLTSVCTDGTCVTSDPKDCSDLNDCTLDSCSEGNCFHESKPFETACVDNDENPCTSGLCNGEGVCEPIGHDDGVPCDDINSCTENDLCLDGFCLGSFVTDGTPCDDFSTCTDPDTCVEGQCMGGRIMEDCLNGIDDNCDGCIDGIETVDAEPCTEEQDPECADPTAMEGECYDGVDNDIDGLIDCLDPDCEGLSCDDGNVCTDDICSGGECLGSPNAASCDDGDVCTDDICNGGTCTGTPNTAPCDDNNGCTENDSCSGGICLPGTEKFCDDENSCTNDFCAHGDCSFEPLTAIACSGDDNPCTDDMCVDGICTHSNNTSSCDDGISCTSSDVCTNGQCIGTVGVEDCSNGIDDDCDFKVDHDDSDCDHLWLGVFVTSQTYEPNFPNITGNPSATGTERADALCQQAAQNASRTGIFKAFVSSIISDAATRILNPNNKPWYMYTATPAKIAENKADLLDGTIYQSISADEFGNNIENPKFTWTGSKTDGTVYLNASNQPVTCSDWTTTKANIKASHGATDKTDYKWVNQQEATCNQEYRIYCFEIETSL